MKNSMRAQNGFGYIAAIVIVVILATLATAAVRLNTTQQASSSQDILSARALQAARAGNELGLYRALVSGNCANTFVGMGSGMSVQVNCNATRYFEGESAPGVQIEKIIYEIDAVACNSSTACPDPSLVATPDYVERRRVVTACIRADNSDC
jgi:MSHA biogenesis protein MshP